MGMKARPSRDMGVLADKAREIIQAAVVTLVEEAKKEGLDLSEERARWMLRRVRQTDK